MELKTLIQKIKEITETNQKPEEQFQDILMEIVNNNTRSYNIILFILQHN